MKTFSSMSVPDKQLTMQAYEKLLQLFNNLIESHDDIPRESKQKMKEQSLRLQQLMEALEMDLLSE
jgi:hypothetical protein